MQLRSGQLQWPSRRTASRETGQPFATKRIAFRRMLRARWFAVWKMLTTATYPEQQRAGVREVGELISHSTALECRLQRIGLFQRCRKFLISEVRVEENRESTTRPGQSLDLDV